MSMVSCPSCRCPVKLAESTCPHCGAGVRQSDGSVARTAVAVMLGLSSAALGGCASAPKYGVPATDDPLVEPAVSSSAAPSAPPSSEPPPVAAEYGVPATDGPLPSAAPSTKPPSK